MPSTVQRPMKGQWPVGSPDRTAPWPVLASSALQAMPSTLGVAGPRATRPARGRFISLLLYRGVEYLPVYIPVYIYLSNYVSINCLSPFCLVSINLSSIYYLSPINQCI